MAVGSVFSALVSVAANGNLDIQPSAGQEAVIHNIYHAFDVDIKFYNGASAITFDTETGAGVLAKFQFHVTNAIWIRVTNRDPSNAQLVGYDGIQTL